MPESPSVEIFVSLSDDDLDSCEVWHLPAAATATTSSYIMVVVNETLLKLICYEKLHDLQLMMNVTKM